MVPGQARELSRIETWYKPEKTRESHIAIRQCYIFRQLIYLPLKTDYILSLFTVFKIGKTENRIILSNTNY